VSALAELLVRYRPDLVRFVERRAGSVLRFESAEDLVQGIHLNALRHGARFRYQGREPFLAWMHTVARHHIATRRAYWHALKRRPRGLLRLTRAPGTDPRGVAEPAAGATGPSTFAGRAEHVARAARALDLLLERDRQLVQWASAGTADAEIAERLGLSRAAAERARQRALGRYRKTFRLLFGD
jgi:RNA polymerase sigma factor (sigma-70 family)